MGQMEVLKNKFAAVKEETLHENPSTYKFLRTQGILPLPSVETIRRYLRKVDLKCGFDPEFLEAFGKKLIGKRIKKNVAFLSLDEIQVRGGFEDFGDNSDCRAKSEHG
uniref:Uncharacterized protein n=1 Tax=Strigamia maritima TaxID=126957 RepID=T1II28_STRMM